MFPLEPAVPVLGFNDPPSWVACVQGPD